MDQKVAVTDKASALAWLETQDHQTMIWFASRCALRALPALGEWSDAVKSGLALATLRATFISAGAGTCPPAEMTGFEYAALSAARSALSAARSALFAARSALSAAISATRSNESARSASAARSVDSAHSAANSARSAESSGSARSAARSADSAGSALSAALSAAQNAMSQDANHPMRDAPLWPNKLQPDEVRNDLHALIQQWKEDDADWSFWVEWYEGILNGTPLPWELTHRIALEVTEKEWEAGQTVVAKVIKEIQADYFAEKLPQAETLSRDVDGKYVVMASVADPDQIIVRIFKQLDFSLDLALRGHNASGFSDMCTAFQYLDHTRQHCRDDPNAVHMHLRLAREIIESRLDTGEYQVEDSLVALVSALERHEIQLRADHPEVRSAYETFVEQRLRELDDEKRLEIAAELKALSNDSKERLSDEFVLDAATLESSTGVKAQGDALKRSGGRSQKMSLTERAASATKAADGSALNKGTGLLLRLEKISDLLAYLF